MDVEKGDKAAEAAPVNPDLTAYVDADEDGMSDEESTLSDNKLLLWSRKMEALAGLESRGIRRVMNKDKTEKSTLTFLQIVLLWLSINTAAQNITLASIAQGSYGLGFTDAALCSVFGGIVGSIPAAYSATWGPISGNRTMVWARYTMGWWPTKICVLLNLVILLGYCMIDCVIAGQMLSAVSANGSLSVVVGIIITAIISWAVSTFGFTIFHYYERYAWVPQYFVLLILYGVTAPKFSTSTQSVGSAATIAGNRLSFFSVCLSAAITYAPDAADFLVYNNPKLVHPWKVFAATMVGLSISFSFCFMLGVGLASGVDNDPALAAAGGGTGALIVAGFDSLGGFGKFCSVIVALGLIANIVPPTYSSGIDFQILGNIPNQIPRFIWNTIGVIIYTICALAGRDHLSEIFTNFLALMGYWVAIWIAITLEEQFIFRRKRGYVWRDWNKPSALPLGIAAFTAFCVGWVGAVLCMAQVYYIGPIARMVGDYGADMGNYVGFAWAALVYPPLRVLELKWTGR
jgi:NCS1 nucleoside transporter family